MTPMRRGSYNEDVRALQKALNRILGTNLTADGQFGPGTGNALQAYHNSIGMEERDANGDAYYGPLTNAQLGEEIESFYITESLYEQAAQAWGVEPAVLKAFALTESKGGGFLPSGFPVILFERHKFYQALRLAYGQTRANEVANAMPDICNPNDGGYLGWEREIPRLERAAQVDWVCAHASASWGAFQLMGFNYDICGFTDVPEMIDAMKTNEILQFEGFMNYCERSNGSIIPALRQRNWNIAAIGYNGRNAIKHGYHTKMAANYKLALGQKT